MDGGLYIVSHIADGYKETAFLSTEQHTQAKRDDATLAIRNFRALVAIANYFDLELKQYDVPTAFLNAKIAICWNAPGILPN